MSQITHSPLGLTRREVYLQLCELFDQPCSYQDRRGKRSKLNRSRVTVCTGVKYKWCGVMEDQYLLVSQYCQQYGLELKARSTISALGFSNHVESGLSPSYWYVTVFIPLNGL